MKLIQAQRVARTLSYFVATAIFLAQVSVPATFAQQAPTTTYNYSLPLSTDDHERIILSPAWDPNQSFCGAGSISTIAGQPANGIWNSGLQQPYILEQYVIEVLKDIAQKEHTGADSAVTQEHVIGLVAFAQGEGGAITNNDLFNVFNTGLDNPALLADPGQTSASGLQSYKSFDAGVEATAEAMTGSYQSRLAQTLIQPNSTAEDFVKALTYYQNYPGNKEWAEASMPTTQNPNQQTQYYQNELQLVQQTRANYTTMAAVALRLVPEPPNYKNPVYPNLLQFHPSGSNGGTGTGGSVVNASASCGTAPSAGAQGIVAEAIRDSWPTSQGTNPKPEYSQDICQYNKGYCQNGIAGFSAADCGVFVATIMHATKADPNYPNSSTIAQAEYVLAHPELYDIQYTVHTTGGPPPLEPGDILILNQGSTYINGVYHVGNGSGGAGHTFIYTGSISGGTNEASASLGDRMPSLGLAGLLDSRGAYLRARLKSSVST